jgi:ribonuclease R/exosome complex exonuclease DIS3/RRP44
MFKKKKKGKSKGTGLTKMLFEFLESHPDKAYNFKQIASALDLRDTHIRNELLKRVKKLVSEKRIKEPVTGRYQ